HVALEVVTNTGGGVGWPNLPLPGPLVPWERAHPVLADLSYLVGRMATPSCRKSASVWLLDHKLKPLPRIMNFRITGAAPRRGSVVASHYPRFRCGGLDRPRLLSGRHPRP